MSVSNPCALTPLLAFSTTAERQEMEGSFNKLRTLGISGELLVRTLTTDKTPTTAKPKERLETLISFSKNVKLLYQGLKSPGVSFCGGQEC
jgi:hypothetical protein